MTDAVDIDTRPCVSAGEHIRSTRHNKQVCPVNVSNYVASVKIPPMPLTARETKNKILANLTESERDDAIVGETKQGGYLIATHNKVIEVYTSGREVYVQAFTNQFDGWEDYDVD